MKRREDISLKAYFNFLFILFLTKLKYFFYPQYSNKKNICTIIFPPALGLGDLIILSKIVDIVLASKKYKKVRVASSAPWIDNKRSEVDYFKLTDTNKLFNSDNFLFPTYTYLNHLIVFLLGKKKCIGYTRRYSFLYLNKEKYFIHENQPYFNRLKPFLIFFDVRLSLKPKIWSKRIIKRREKRIDYYNFRDVLMKDKKKEIYIIAVSTYKFYSKFRPSIKIIIDNIQQKLLEIEKDIYVVILGSNSKAEIIYNEHLYIKLKSLTNKVDNTSGLLNLNQAIDIITQSDYYIGANNGLSNIAQIAGSYGMQLFSGPEKPLVRKFSNKMDFQYIKPNT